LLVKTGLVDRELALGMWADTATSAWEDLATVAAIARRNQGDGLWENFECFAVLSQDWLSAHPDGAYPAGVRRIILKDQWSEVDAQYAASRGAPQVIAGDGD